MEQWENEKKLSDVGNDDLVVQLCKKVRDQKVFEKVLAGMDEHSYRAEHEKIDIEICTSDQKIVQKG